MAELCLITCTVLHFICQTFNGIMDNWKIPPYPNRITGINHDDFTFGFIENESDIINMSECQ